MEDTSQKKTQNTEQGQFTVYNTDGDSFPIFYSHPTSPAKPKPVSCVPRTPGKRFTGAVYDTNGDTFFPLNFSSPEKTKTPTISEHNAPLASQGTPPPRKQYFSAISKPLQTVSPFLSLTGVFISTVRNFLPVFSALDRNTPASIKRRITSKQSTRFYLLGLLTGSFGNWLQARDNREINKQFSAPLQDKIRHVDTMNMATYILALGGLLVIHNKVLFSSSPFLVAFRDAFKRCGDNFALFLAILTRYFNTDIAIGRANENQDQWTRRDKEQLAKIEELKLAKLQDLLAKGTIRLEDILKQYPEFALLLEQNILKDKELILKLQKEYEDSLSSEEKKNFEKGISIALVNSIGSKIEQPWHLSSLEFDTSYSWLYQDLLAAQKNSAVNQEPLYKEIGVKQANNIESKIKRMRQSAESNTLYSQLYEELSATQNTSVTNRNTLYRKDTFPGNGEQNGKGRG